MNEQYVPERRRMRGPNLAVLVERVKGVPIDEALRRADEAGSVIASNNRLNQALESDEWGGVRGAFPCWSGTIVAYVEPGRKLVDHISYNDTIRGRSYIFPVPEEHRGRENVVLVAEHPDFTLETNGRSIIVHAKQVGVVSGFPADSHTYHLPDPIYGIPSGERVDQSNPAAKSIWRADKMVTLVNRGCDSFGFGYERIVYLNNWPCEAFGVAVEAK